MTSSPAPTALATPAPWQSIDPAEHDVRLVVCDMDGTLLDARGEFPAGFARLAARMRERGITFVPASGRQHATLARMFPEHGSFIAENGNLVVHGGEVISTTCVEHAVVREVIDLARTTREADVGLVVCGVRSAYIERTDPEFVAEAEKYYARLEVVEDLTRVDDDVLKVACFDFVDAEATASTMLGHLVDTHQVVVSGKHWVDVMHPEANKGVGVRALQDALGVTHEQTVAFGDYLNDLELLDEAGLPFAMANAHPEVTTRARFRAPSNAEGGVVVVLEHLLG